MSPTRREALAQLAALAAAAAVRLPGMSYSPPSDPLDGTIADYQAGRRRGDWTAEEVTKRALERCHTDGKLLHAIDVLSNDALAEARASDARLRAGKLRGPLDGVPVFAKAIYDVKGLPTTGSSAAWALLFPDPVRRDSIEVSRIRATGAVILGKTAADDFAFHGNGTSSYTGQVLNPYDPSGTRTPGGSSAGSAVAVADGMAFAALGTDDGGSNRIPAQFTGIVGMKPSFGLVPRTGVIPTWPYLDTHGPLSRYVADAALYLAAIAGPDPSDPLALTSAFDPAPLASLRDDALNGVRIGVVEGNVPRELMSAESLANFDRAVKELRAAGAIVEPFASPVTSANYRDLFKAAAKERGDVEPNDWTPAPTANAYRIYWEGRSDDPRRDMRLGYPAYRSFYEALPETYEKCEPFFDQPMTKDAAGQSFAKSRATIVAQLVKEMRAAKIEAMVWPTMPFPAPLAVDSWPKIRTTLSYNNWLGLPEVSVPAGYGTNGMPDGNLSVVGFPGDDARVLAFAHAYERQSRKFVRPPRPGRRAS
ncbi:MAG TPA: amidase [Gemmatimonadaceae bacterium]|jgi:Asp-tRNA(Asn)/Glu-tRNA(Gln) amidotransferase A subunit family amidase|nr:amidase [Gemmatimonadaceae bacterium]